MLIHLLSWFFIFFTTLSFGFYLDKLVKKWFSLKKKTTTIDFLIIFGFCTITILGSIWSLFYKINFAFTAVLYTTSFVIVFLFKNEFIEQVCSVIWKSFNNHQLWLKILLPSVGILTLYLASVKPIVYDTGLYHAQSIQWINEYAVVPGLGNLHGRLAFNSHFFISSAIYSFSLLSDNDLYPVNSYLLLVLIASCLTRIGTAVNTNDAKRVILNGSIILCVFYFLNPYFSSPTPDIGLAVLIIFTVIYFFEIESKGDQIDSIYLILISAVTITFKLSSLLIILLPMYSLRYSEYRNVKTICSNLVLGCIVILPFVIRNLIISGHIVYPIPGLDLTSFEWKLGQNKVLLEYELIKSWARIPYKDAKEVLSMNMSEWIGPWWKSLTHFPVQLLLLINLVSPLAILINVVKNKKFSAINALQLVLLLNLIIWFLSAPDPRFSYGVLFANASLLFALFFDLVKLPSKWVAIAFSILFLIIVPSSIWRFGQIKNILVSPSQIDAIATNSKKIINSTITVPIEGDRCFNSPLPCSPYYYANLELRGKDLQSGFRIYNETRYNHDARNLLRKQCSDSVKVANDVLIRYYKELRKILIEFPDTAIAEDRFFMHVVPEDLTQLTPEQVNIGFINADFTCKNFEPSHRSKYYKVVNLQPINIAQINLGQFNKDGRLWSVVFSEIETKNRRDFQKQSSNKATTMFQLADVTKVSYFSKGNYLLYEMVNRKDLDNRFYLHLIPESLSDLNDKEKKVGFKNLDFQWNLNDKPINDKFYKKIDLPTCKLKEIQTGQFNSNGRIWSTSINTEEE